jgi:hypothetical protein
MPGRPSVITPKTVSKLIASFNLGCSIREACWQSGVSHEALKAKEVVISAIYVGDLNAAIWWLDRKAKNEFGRDSA